LVVQKTAHTDKHRERERERDVLGLLGREKTVKDLFRRESNLVLNPNIENVGLHGLSDPI
jgi:hypothetical protein